MRLIEPEFPAEEAPVFSAIVPLFWADVLVAELIVILPDAAVSEAPEESVTDPPFAPELLPP